MIKEKLKSGFDFLFAPFAKKLGYKKIVYLKSTQTNIDTSQADFFSLLVKINFKPTHIVDVGANKGNWTREVLKFFPNSYYTLLEPQAQMKDFISDILQTNPKITFNAMGAGSKNGNFKFTIVDRHDSCSFNYSEEEAIRRGFSQIEVPVVTLNNFLPTTNLPVPEIIKIDAEGLDIEVLSGANNFFGKTEVFFVETVIMNKNSSNTPLEILSIMNKSGYKLLDVINFNRTPTLKALWLMDLVFIKRDGVIDNKITGYN